MIERQADLFKSALKTVNVPFQNLDSSEISITHVSHYYNSNPTKVVQCLCDDKKKPMILIVDTTILCQKAQVCSLSETVCLDACTKFLNHKFYGTGYKRVREI